MACTCGFSTDYPNCNGTHKIVKKVREDMAIKVQNWIDSQQLWSNEDLINFIKTGK